MCFGWIDSKPNKRDAESYYLFFAQRNPKSNWSQVNKDRVAKLVESGLMTEAGFKMIEIAQQTGTWNALDEVERLRLPQELQEKLERNPKAKEHFSNFPKSVKRGILEWILNAKRPETRLKRIEQTVELAEQNKRANQFHKT